MPKPMYVWTGTAWVSVASEVESLATYATQSYADNQPGMKMIVPSSVAVGSGSGSVSTQGTVTFSGASSVSINGCFSSTYQNYLIIWDFVGSTAVALQVRMRASGTDATGANYSTQLGSDNSTTANALRVSASTFFDMFQTGHTTDRGQILFQRPFDAVNTSFIGNSFDVGGIYSQRFGGTHEVASSYDGFTFRLASGTFSGTIRIYGYKVG